MTIEDLCKRYLAALNAGDLGSLRRLFTPDATVVSPLYGTKAAAGFYAEVYADTSRSETTLLNIFHGAIDTGAVALHFRYRWTLSSGHAVEFQCVDVFELAEDPLRFRKLTIIYDTAPLRSDFEAIHR